MSKETKDGPWILEIEKPSMVATVIGSYEVMCMAVDEWKAWLADVSRDDHAIIDVNGYADDHKRSQISITTLTADIRGMSLREDG